MDESSALACDLTQAATGRLTGTVAAADDDGSSVFPDLGSGHYTVTAVGYAQVVCGVDVEDETVAPLEIVLGTPSTLQVDRDSVPAS